MENVKNSICLFDVDGTLTESRRRIDKQMLDVLRELSFTTEIGLLTGSGLEYIKEQLWPLLADKELSLNCHVLPCNGTEYYIPNPESPGNFIEIHRNSLESHPHSPVGILWNPIRILWNPKGILWHPIGIPWKPIGIV